MQSPLSRSCSDTAFVGVYVTATLEVIKVSLYCCSPTSGLFLGDQDDPCSGACLSWPLHFPYPCIFLAMPDQTSGKDLTHKELIERVLSLSPSNPADHRPPHSPAHHLTRLMHPPPPARPTSLIARPRLRLRGGPSLSLALALSLSRSVSLSLLFSLSLSLSRSLS